jgi:hypothetical protein
MRLTHEDKERLAQWCKETIGGIPENHDWSRAVVTLVKQMRDESMPYLVAPPESVTAEDRIYNAGRVAFAEDLLHRLGRWQVVAAVARASESTTVPDSPSGDSPSRL